MTPVGSQTINYWPSWAQVSDVAHQGVRADSDAATGVANVAAAGAPVVAAEVSGCGVCSPDLSSQPPHGRDSTQQGPGWC